MISVYQIFCAILAIHVLSAEARHGNYVFRFSRRNTNNCVIKSSGLKTIRDVQDVIDKAKEGDVIRMDPISYEGDLHIRKSNNRRFISLVGDNQCHNNTVIRGKVTVEAENWIVNAIVFELTDTVVDVKNSANIQLKNMVMNQINGNAITVANSKDISVDNLVIDNVAKNAVDLRQVSQTRVRNAVISNVGGVAIMCDNCQQIDLVNNVARNVVQEVIKITGQRSGNVNIAQTVINGDSRNGQAWMYLDGNSYRISNTVATGAPRNGIVVNGCNNDFSSNIFTMRGNGYGILLNNKQGNCRNNIGFTNMNMGGRGLHN